MNRPKAQSKSLGDLETEVMKVLWKMKQGTVPEVLEQLEWERSLAYTTVMTVLGRLVEKGYLKREKEGRFYVYSPRVARGAVAASALRNVVDRFFDGIRGEAVLQLLNGDDELSERDLKSLERLIRNRRKERT